MSRATTTAARALARRRWAGTTAKDRSEIARKMASARWAKLTPPERSAEMRRRRRKGLGIEE